jgi:protein O-mannosyl-transferase
MKETEKDTDLSYHRRVSNKAILTKPGWFPLFLFTATSFLLYLPVLNRYFVSDDFKVLRRVCFDHIIFIKGFFRPLSDLSIYMNYRLGGLEPEVFNSFNILIHGTNAFLLYRVCFRFGRSWSTTHQIYFAGITGFLFLTYPFHNEAVVWLLGRGASMACLFSLLGLLFFYEIKNPAFRRWAVAGCYFISLAAFESTIIFPLVLIPLLIREKEKSKNIMLWCFYLILGLSIHLILRFIISGTLFGSYGEEFLASGLQRYISNLAKVAGRLFLPPSENRFLLSALFILCISMIIYFLSKNYGKVRNIIFRKDLLLLLLLLAISCVIPVISGISTQTSESDRMLYFPSVFLCMAVGYIPVFLIKSKKLKIIFVIFILCYNVFFLERNNLNWKKASLVSFSIINTVLSDSTNPKIFFINIPNEIEGAYVFRLGFGDALLMNGKDSTKAVPVNYLTRMESEKFAGKILPVRSAAHLFIPPDVVLIQDSSQRTFIYAKNQLRAVTGISDKIYYWNRETLESIPAFGK